MRNDNKFMKLKFIMGLTLLTVFVLVFNINRLTSMAYISVIENSKVFSKTLNKADQMSQQAVKEDFDYFMNIVKTDYPYLEINQRLNNIDFIDKEEHYWDMIKNVKTKTEFVKKLTIIISNLNNGHTDLIPINDQSRMRDMYYKAYGGFVQNGGLMGSVYKPWVDVLESKESQALYGSLPSLLEPKDQRQNSKSKGQEEAFKNNVETKVIENGTAIYIKIKTFHYLNEQVDGPIIIDFIKKHLSAKALVIDIRENGGGSTEYFKNLLVEPLLKESLTVTRYNLIRDGVNNKSYIEAISNAYSNEIRPISELDPKQFPKAKPEVFTKFDLYMKDTMTYSPKNSLGYKGKIYILVSGRVYSASEAFASFSKETGFATLIGQQTGGDGYGTDPALFCLPNSGIIGRYPFQYGMMSNGEANEEVKTQPDYYIGHITVADNLMLDKCIEKVIELENL